MSLKRRFGVWALTLLGGLGLIVTLPSPGRAEQPFGAVDARAGADALRLGVAVRKFLIVENFVDAGGPTAQAHLTSVGSDAFAALPDPGGLVINYNTFVGLATGSGLPFDYPFFAQAKFPGSPSAATADPSGAYAVSAKTAADGAEALARMRPTAGDMIVTGAVAHATVKAGGDVITATSETSADAVSLAQGAVKLAGVASRSVTTRHAGRAEPDTETALSVDLITVGDQRIRYGAKGFELLGTPVPVPSDAVAAALAGALKPLGLSFDIGKPVAVAGGMQAAALEIRQASPLPAGQSDLVLRLGGATSSIAAEDGVASVNPAVPSPPAASASEGAPASTDSAAPGVPAPSAAFALPPDNPMKVAAPRLDFAPAPVVAEPEPTVTQPRPTTAPPSTTGTLQSAAPPRLASHRQSVAGPFGALVAAGLAIVVVSALWARKAAAAALWGNP